MTKYKRIAIIDKDKCQPKACNYLCYRSCPPVRMGQDAITIENKETNTPPTIVEELCTGCGICVSKCPFNAIKIINIGIDVSDPIHQYGINSFRLYKLPVIEKGKITGLIGINGTGKTTAINILSGNIIANLGDYNNPKPNIQDVIDYYKGKNIQKYFIDIKNKKQKIAQKIQKIEEISKHFKEPIIQLLKKVTTDEQKLQKILEDLELTKIQNKTPQEISGGELQRVAIAATLLKDASIYFFDEYTTYLDIKQRFKIARLLREKISEDKSILLIEHDLAILDYLSDYIQVMFGVKKAYGMCSNKKTTKKGINEFLDGFLKEENIRFRTNSIQFNTLKTDIEKTNTKLIEYPEITKKLGSFKLNIKPARINKAEIIGVLGPNAIGKSTFIKILAGELEADNIKLKDKLKVSYKPQTIDLDNDLLVSELFTGKDIDIDIFNSEIRSQLGIDKIFDQKVGELSGGELQKVAVAHAICKIADIYLIDEPSAFLDVEQRIIISNIIKNVINKKELSALVVDHDILFLDYISDRILLFEGIPGEYGVANEISTIESAFNKFLKEQDITYRQDPQTKRPRANKPGSQKDQEQKRENRYYVTL